jgi:Uma2 family endonuclease
MAVQIRQMTVEEYLAFDESSESQHEYIDGELIPMPGGTGSHNLIVASTSSALVVALSDRDCFVFGSQMRIGIDATNYLYPDVSVVCGRPSYADDNEVVLINPTVVVEVTSPSSIERDRVAKVDLYSAVASIQGYLILDQECVFAQWHTRAESGWRRQQFTDLDDEIELQPLDCAIRLAQVYHNVDLEA